MYIYPHIIIPTAGGNMVIFKHWEVYRRLYNANSGIVLILPSNRAG